MKKVVILVGGKGSKLWPYGETRNKSMISISNKPIVKHLVDGLYLSGIKEIIIVGNSFINEISNVFRKDKNIKVIDIEDKGAAYSLLSVEEYIKDEEFIVLYGDCLIQVEDIKRLVEGEDNSVLVSPIYDDAKNWIACKIDNDSITEFGGHHRGNSLTHIPCGFKFNKDVFEYLRYNSGKLKNTKVGVGSPEEMFLESSINDMLQDGVKIKAIESKFQCFDVDRPWNILEANDYNNKRLCESLSKNELKKGATISDKAFINGFVSLGQNSYIGQGVVINGNVIIGDNTVIDNGAIIEKNVVIGNNCSIKNNCKIGSNSTICDECIMDQTAELIGGIIMRKSYLYHYGEYFGVLGENSDLGAGTTCGTLRFDDGETTHYTKGRREIPSNFSNAAYIGDYVRTGVGAIISPGCKVGCRSVVGSGVILNNDLESNTMVYVKQELIKRQWGGDKYGW